MRHRGSSIARGLLFFVAASGAVWSQETVAAACADPDDGRRLVRLRSIAREALDKSELDACASTLAREGGADEQGLRAAALAYVWLSLKDYRQSEEWARRSLELNPNNSWASYWLASAISLQHTPRQPEMLYHLARAVSRRGEGELDVQPRRALRDYLEMTYAAFHGSTAGFDELLAAAVREPFPPAGFSITAAATACFDSSVARKYLWQVLKQGITPRYFRDTLRGASLPQLVGTVVSALPRMRPDVIRVAILGEPEEILLRLDTPYPAPLPAGVRIEFESGIAVDWRETPFLLTIRQSRAKMAIVTAK